MKTSASVDLAFEEGFDAYYNVNISHDDNLYPAGTQEHEAWFAGWEYAALRK